MRERLGRVSARPFLLFPSRPQPSIVHDYSTIAAAIAPMSVLIGTGTLLDR